MPDPSPATGPSGVLTKDFVSGFAGGAGSLAVVGLIGAAIYAWRKRSSSTSGEVAHTRLATDAASAASSNRRGVYTDENGVVGDEEAAESEYSVEDDSDQAPLNTTEK